jgi:hypothetical protein
MRARERAFYVCIRISRSGLHFSEQLARIEAGAGKGLPLSLPVGSELVAKLDDMHVHAKGGVTVDAGRGEVLEPVPSIKPGP